MRAPNLSFVVCVHAIHVRVFVTRAPHRSWNEWVLARDNKGPLLTDLVKTHPGLSHALAKEDAIDNVIPGAVVAMANRKWSTEEIAVVMDMRARDPPAPWATVCPVLLRGFSRHFSHPTRAQIGVATNHSGSAAQALHRRELKKREDARKAEAKSARKAAPAAAPASGRVERVEPAQKRQRVTYASVPLPSLVPLPLRPSSHLRWRNAGRATGRARRGREEEEGCRCGGDRADQARRREGRRTTPHHTAPHHVEFC